MHLAARCNLNPNWCVLPIARRWSRPMLQCRRIWCSAVVGFMLQPNKSPPRLCAGPEPASEATNFRTTARICNVAAIVTIGYFSISHTWGNCCAEKRLIGRFHAKQQHPMQPATGSKTVLGYPQDDRLHDGLGVTTVSRALKDAPEIGEETRSGCSWGRAASRLPPEPAGVRLRTGKTT